MLKFKDFVNYLEESSLNEKRSRSWRKPYTASYLKNVSSKDPINTKTNELVRGSFGQDSVTDPEPSNTVKNNIDRMFTDVGETVIGIEKFLPGTNRVQGSHGSGDMVTYLVTTDKNGDGYYITNNSTSTKVKVEGIEKLFRPKDLTPTKLGLDNVDYTSKDVLCAKTISAVKSFVQDELHQKFMLELIDVCKEPKNYGFSTTPKDSINDTAGNYKINYDFTDFEKISQLGNLGDIQNDFGEVLGSIFVFNLVKPEAIGGGVSYPSGNEKLMDFRFDGKEISSKAGSGAAATLTEYIRRIDGTVANGWQLTPEQIEAKDKILLPLSLGESTKERSPKKWFGSRARGSGVFTGAITLFNALNLKGWITFKKEFGLSDSDDINRDDIIDAFDRLGSRGILYKGMKVYSNSVKFSPRTKNKLFLNILNANNVKESKQSWLDFTNEKGGPEYSECLDLLIGSVLYPCSNEVTDYISNVKHKSGKTYGETINDMINYAISVFQLNFKISLNKDSMTFDMYNSKESKYKIQGLNSFGQPLMANFKIKKK
jgi:hypothetical protein